MSKQWDAWPEIEIGGGFCGLMERPGMVLKSISWAVIFAFVWNAGLPLAEAAANGTLSNPPVSQSTQQPMQQTQVSEEDEFTETLQEIEAKIAKISAKLSSGEDDAVEQDDLKKLEQKIRKLSAKLESKFLDEENELKAKKLPQVILDRQAAMVQMYQDNLATLLANIQAIGAAVTPAEKKRHADRAKKHLEDKKHKHKSDFDPNDMPFGTHDGKKTRKPIETKKEFKTSGLFQDEGVMVAALGSIQLPANAGNTPTALDLAETIDVQITQPIRDLSASLDNNPVKIYNWVHDNIRFMPTYGSIQGSDMTLQTKQGNAFDTSSLLIAMLRAAGIHARYGYGTVQIPIEKVMNWVGGVTDPVAAANLIASGGIPGVTLVSGGKIIAVKMEQVWVEAWVDYYPSRAAKNLVGDSWVSMDASFKQYTYTRGMDLQTAVPFDAYAFMQQATATAQVDATLGSVTGVDNNAMQVAVNAYQTQLLNHINTTDPYATVADVLGSQSINPSLLPNHLASGLPYKLITRGSTFPALSNNLRHSFSFDLFGSQMDQVLGSSALSFNQSLPELAGKKITFGFAPATTADEALVDSYLPKPHADGSPILPSEFPASLPGYLVHLKGELRVDGQVVATGGNFTMGQQLVSTTALNDPSFGATSATNQPIAGDYMAIGLDMGSISETQLTNARQDMRTVSSALAQGTGIIARDDVMGGLFSGGIWSYFAMLDQQRERAAKQAGIQSYRAPSFGLMGSSVVPSYFFGIPRNVSSGGVFMDVDKIMVMLVSHDNDPIKARNFMMGMGLQSSALEHGIPEMMFSDPLNPVEGVSTVKLLQKASLQGQTVYTMDKNNVNTVLPLLGMGVDTKNDIRAAINAGKIVTAHQTAITVGTWSGFGYTVIDPVTGAGAYMISGGTNGGFIDWLSNMVTAFSIKVDIQTTLVKAGGGVAKAVTKISILLGVILGIMKAIFSCNSQQATRDMIVATTFINLLGIQATAIAWAAIASPLGVLVAGIAIAFAVYAIIGHLYSIDPNCVAQRKLRLPHRRYFV